MSTPRDGGPGDAQDRPEDQPGWTEPTHLGGSGGDTTGGDTTGRDSSGRDSSGGDSSGGDSSGGDTTGPAGGAPADRPTEDDGAGRAWEPPGWSLPSAEPDRPQPWSPPTSPPAGSTPPSAQPPAPGPAQDWDATPPRAPEPWDAPGQPEPWDAPQQRTDQQPPQERRRGGLLGGLFGGGGGRGGLFGGGRGSQPQQPGPQQPGWGEEQQLGQAFEPAVDPTDRYGTRSWAAATGWTATDGSGPEDAAVTALVQTAPIRPGKQDVPGNVLRGRADGLDLVALDVLSPVSRGWGITHAITAAPLLGSVPDFRLTPARFWRHGTGGLLQIPSGDPEFDQRYVLLTTADGPEVRRVADDPVVRQALLGSDDGDEIWAAVGFVAAVRPDAHRPLLIQHHARLLAAVSAALAAGSSH